MIDNKTLDLINEKTDIVSLVSEFVSLEKVGKNYRGLCPFHNEKTPSFSVSPEKNIAKCMGCGEGGNPINFYRKIRNITFSEAAAELAERAGIEVKQSIKKVVDKNEKYYQILEDATSFYKYVLKNSEIGKEAQNYLQKREIDENAISHFQIGVSPKAKDSLYRLLSDKNYKVSDMIDLGLVKQGDDGEYYDLFTARLMFPITNHLGRVVGFSGRAIDSKEQIKYINSPETIIFKKGLLLYNYFESLSEIRKQKQVILVEGFFDCISPYRIGIKNIVASMGTALTNDQVKLIQKVTEQVLICYDGDNAGQKATVSAIEKLLNANLRVEVLKIPDGLDPDEFIKQYGPERFESLFGEYTVDGYRFIYEYNKLGKDFKNANDIKEFKDSMNAFLNKVDKSAKDFYINLIKDELGIVLNPNLISKKIEGYKPYIPKRKLESKIYDNTEREIIIAALKDNSLIPIIESSFKLYLDIKLEECIFILQTIYQIKDSEENISIETLLKYIKDNNARKYLIELSNNAILKDKTAIIDAEGIKEYKKTLEKRKLDQEIDELNIKISIEPDPIKKIELAKKRDEIKKNKDGWG
ncbi:DNA primase [Acholeplasma sp. OttesenSCG-928-E16]|nr:DNA primase [Acholeplasma sp. OttesenSCG-928-E16]